MSETNGKRLLDFAGNSAQDTRWEEPGAGSPYFGWVDSGGAFITIKLENVIAVAPMDKSGRLSAVMSTGQPVVLTCEAGDRLMKRMGWKERERINRA